jgi:8-oxo-dGTP diphosphatase
MLPESQAFFKVAVSVDNIIFGFDRGKLNVLLIKRAKFPYEGEWALPGYLVFPEEDIEEAADRVLYELTGLKNVPSEQVKTFGSVERHPEGRVITVAYYSLIKQSDYADPAPRTSYAREAKWFSINQLPAVAFDHKDIIEASISRLQRRVRTQPIGFDLLPPKFTLSDLQALYESILNTVLEKRNFRKKIMSMSLLTDEGVTQEGVAHRPARLFSFSKTEYDQLVESEGFVFKI